MKRKENRSSKNWQTLNLRAGTDPRRLQDLDRQGLLEIQPQVKIY